MNYTEKRYIYRTINNNECHNGRIMDLQKKRFYDLRKTFIVRGIL